MLLIGLVFAPLATVRAAVPPASLRTTPAAGIRIADADRARLEKGVTALGAKLDELRAKARSNPRLGELLPDVEIFHKAVDWPLRYDEFFRSNEVALAGNLIRLGTARAQQLADGKPAWLMSTGLVVRGFRSKIDGSVQPYGLVVPATFSANTNRARRLDVWLHGRDDKLTELKFIGERLRSYGEFTPPDTLVLHPYGRFCNAFKFAGETDVFEALAHAQEFYPVDTNRLGLRGFSMGGAGVWHLAAHYPGVWAAAAPGAGFAETAEYTGALKKEPKPNWWEQKLWRLYDATEYAANFHNLPVIAYSGELDKQKQAADVMARATRAAGLELQHIIGPKTEHKYEPGAKRELVRRFDEIVEKGRELYPKRISLTTSTLRYNQYADLTLDGMAKLWEPAQIELDRSNPEAIQIRTTNVTRFSFVHSLPELKHEGKRLRPALHITVDSTPIVTSVPASSEVLTFMSISNRWWQFQPNPGLDWPYSGKLKCHRLQGPIDDAFMDSFTTVRPASPAANANGGSWIDTELARFSNEWRAQFRGDARVIDANEDEVGRAAKDGSHLILWGDPASNPIIAKLLPKLPLKWDAKELRFGTNRFDAATHVPVLIFPNPMNPSRYIVLNSGPTFLDFGAASNAQQTPKLPDYAVIDITVPRKERLTRGVKLAGFFDENWQLPADAGAAR